MSKKTLDVEWFIRRVLEGDYWLDAGTMLKLSNQLGLQMENKQWYCVAVRYSDQLPSAQDAERINALLEACCLAGKKAEAYCYIGAHLYVVMLIAAGQEERISFLKKLQTNISKYSKSSVQMGVGRVYSDLEKLSYSRVEAYEALRCMAMNDDISYIDDIYAVRSMTSHKLDRDKRRVMELFRSGNLEQMMTSVLELTETIRAESPVREGMPYPSSIRRTIVELLLEIMHIGSDAGVDVEEILDHQDPYSRIFGMEDTPNILAWFILVVKKISAAMSEVSNKTEKNVLTLAKRCVETHLANPELSLSFVSDQLGMTSTYFSAFFIREVGIGFNEYVNDLRIAQAKRLLRETNSRISDIAAQCGFRSSSYFIVVFRKQLGMSPGEYRNTKN